MSLRLVGLNEAGHAAFSATARTRVVLAPKQATSCSQTKLLNGLSNKSKHPMSSAGASNVAVAMANSQLQIQAALKHCAYGAFCEAMVLVERLRHDP